jgi:hypothetical protein
VLGPTIRRGDIFVLDNLSAHHAGPIEEEAGKRGASVIERLRFADRMPFGRQRLGIRLPVIGVEILHRTA